MATFVHMAFGFYMFSNSQIFTVSSDGDFAFTSSISGSIDLSSVGSSGYISGARLSQPHVILYLVILMIVIGIFLITRAINTFFPNVWSKLFVCVKCLATQIETLSGERYKIDDEKAYSNNMYKEMIIDDLKVEYNKTKTEEEHYKLLVEAGGVKKEIKAVEYLIKKYD
jgi:hypothetical protein